MMLEICPDNLICQTNVNSNPDIYIVDTTLRDGEQAPGVAFSLQEKVTIAQLLNDAGVSEIEAGIPAMGEMEQQTVQAIINLKLTSRVIAWNRMVLNDLKASLNCGVRNIHISAPVSALQIHYKLNRTPQWVLDTVKKAISYALDYGCRVTVGAEDASRADHSFLLEFALLVQEMGAVRLRYCDTVGILDPFTTFDNISKLKNELALGIEFHGHNDFGMATANTLAAIKAGANYVDTTIGGLGERAGNACMDQLNAALKQIQGIDTGLDPQVLLVLNRHVAQTSGRKPVASYRLSVIS